ncbi:MAG: STAS domain-containing protein [Leptolyngbyaceae bacterium]|nr:STAS domain-containing protein [Leptolyngbyaceae bacterium]
MSRQVKIFQPTGILDGARANQLRREISEVITSGPDVVLLDLKEVTFMDSSGLGALVSALKSVRSSGGKLFVCSINDQVKMLFELTSMDRVFEIYPNQDAFHQAVLAAD